MYARWHEVFDISKLTFVDHEECVRLETERGDCLRIYTNVDRMEAELLKWAPQDAAEISAARQLAKWPMSFAGKIWPSIGSHSYALSHTCWRFGGGRASLRRNTANGSHTLCSGGTSAVANWPSFLCFRCFFQWLG
jgi:hypothetical protein